MSNAIKREEKLFSRDDQGRSLFIDLHGIHKAYANIMIQCPYSKGDFITIYDEESSKHSMLSMIQGR